MSSNNFSKKLRNWIVAARDSVVDKGLFKKYRCMLTEMIQQMGEK